MSFTAEQKEAIEILVGLCTSCKEASPLPKLLREYWDMELKELDYTGFNTVPNFLRASDRFHLTNRNGTLYVTAKLTKRSAHIAILVNKQKSTGSGFISSSSGSGSQSYSYNKSVQLKKTEKPVLSNFKLTKRFNNTRFPKKDLPPLPSQLAKVVHPTTAKIKSEFETPSQKPVDLPPLPSQLAKVVHPSTKIKSEIEFKSQKQVDLPPLPSQLAKVIHPTATHIKSELELPSQRPVVEVALRPLPKLNVVKNDLSVSKPVEQFTKQPVLEQIKTSVAQECLHQMKHSKKSKVTKEKEKQMQKYIIPIEWWAFGNYSKMGRLQEYCRITGFTSPEYNMFISTMVGKPKYQCRCSVNNVTYTTYPDHFDKEDEARYASAARAVSIIRQHEELAQYPLFEGHVREITSKIYEIVSEHEAGVSLSEIEYSFRKKHKVSLPSDFVDVIRDNKHKFIINNSNNYDSVCLNKTDHDTFLSDKCKNLRELKLPWSKTTWSVNITYPETTTSAWAILKERHYYDEYKKSMEKIDKAQLNYPTRFQQGHIYITVVQGKRQRVKLIEKMNHEYLSHFIDSGERKILSYSELFECDPKFLDFPAQAFQLTLKGLSMFDKLVGIKNLLLDYSNQVEFVVVHSLEYQQDNKVEVTLHGSDLDTNINDKLLEQLTKIVSKPVQLKEKCTPITITGLQDSGIVTAYLTHENYNDMIKNEIKRLLVDKNLLQRGIVTLDDLNEAQNEMYLVWNHISSEYLRGFIVDINRNENIVVLLIDYGTEIFVKKNITFYRISSISKTLTIIPPQAIKMRFHNVQIDDPTEISLIRGYLIPYADSYATIIEQNDLPSVEIYIKKCGKLICINEEIKTQMSFEPVLSSVLSKN